MRSRSCTRAICSRIGVRELVLVPFAGEVDRGVVGVARLYDERFDEAEVALLEAVVESMKHALERIRLGEERDVLLARERAARREAEERGQAARVLGYVADGVFLVDAKGAVQLWNPAAEAITGVPAEAVLGRPVEEVIPGWEALAQAVADRERSGCMHRSCDDASRRDPRS